MRGQLLLGKKRGKERRDLARPDEASSVLLAECFFHSVPQTSDLSASHSPPFQRPNPTLQRRGPSPHHLPLGFANLNLTTLQVLGGGRFFFLRPKKNKWRRGKARDWKHVYVCVKGIRKETGNWETLFECGLVFT